MIKHNLDFLVRVEVEDFTDDIWIEWKNEIRIFGFVWRKKGLYWGITAGFYSSEIPKNRVIKDGIIMYKPSVTLYYNDDSSKTYRFDSLEEAEQWAAKFTIKDKWI